MCVRMEHKEINWFCTREQAWADSATVLCDRCPLLVTLLMTLQADRVKIQRGKQR